MLKQLHFLFSISMRELSLNCLIFFYIVLIDAQKEFYTKIEKGKMPSPKRCLRLRVQINCTQPYCVFMTS